MSRDQRPRRDVLVDSAPDLPAAANGATGAGADPVPARPVAAKPRLLIPSLLFLLACAAGAVAIALMPLGGM